MRLAGIFLFLFLFCVEAVAEQCNDGIDNDGDGLIDFGFDLSCVAGTDDSEAGTTGTLESGWTNFEPSVDSRIIYVSDSGSDSNDGLSASTPKLTPDAGMNLVRDGFPDWLLFERSSVFDTGFPALCESGRSTSEPIVYSSYGATGDRAKFTDGAFGTSGGGCSPTSVDNVVFVSLHFEKKRRNPSDASYAVSTDKTGIGWLRGANNIILEDVVTRWIENSFDDSIDNQPVNGIEIRRSQFTDSWNLNSNGFASGIFFCTTGDATVTESYFDRNGWNPDIPGASASVFNHHVYSDVCSGAALNLQGNIFTRGAAGDQVRNGGSVNNNLWDGSAISANINPSNVSNPSTFNNNVIMNGVSLDQKGDDDGDYAWGSEIKTGAASLTATGNVIANCNSVTCNAIAANLDVYDPDTVVFNWAGSGAVTAKTSGELPDSTRSIQTYNSTQCGGSATESDFVAGMRAQSRMNWNTCYENSNVIDWVRAGFIASGASSVRFGGSIRFGGGSLKFGS